MLKRIKAVRVVMIAVMTLTLCEAPSARGAIIASQDGFTTTQTFNQTSENDYVGFDITSVSEEVIQFRLRNFSLSGLGIPFVAVRQLAVGQVITSTIATSTGVSQDGDVLVVEFNSFNLLTGQYALSLPYLNGAKIRTYERYDPSTKISNGATLGTFYGEAPFVGPFEGGIVNRVPVEIISVPEPSSAFLIIFSGGICLIRRRR